MFFLVVRFHTDPHFATWHLLSDNIILKKHFFAKCRRTGYARCSTQDGFTRDEHKTLLVLDLSRKEMVPSYKLYCELQTIPNLLCFLCSSIQLFVLYVPLGDLSLIWSIIGPRTVGKHTFCLHLRAIKRPNCLGCAKFLPPKWCGKLECIGHPCSFRYYLLWPQIYSTPAQSLAPCWLPIAQIYYLINKNISNK